jgi:TP901 family phage tail tape measure protein
VNFVSSITLAFKDAFSSGFNDAKDSLAGMRGALDEIGKNQSMTRLAADMAMMTSMTEPMRKALSDAMDQPSRIAGTLDTSFRSIQVSLGATNEEMAATRRELLAISGRAVAGPEAVANAFSNVASGVADASKHMAIMNAAVSLAEANQADLAMSTNAMVNVMNAWNISADDAALAADILTQTSIMGVGSLGEFAGYIGQISTLAASAGIGLDELGASFAYVTNTGMSAAQTKRQLNYIISKLVSPSETLSKLYESLGIECGQAMIQQYGLAESLYILKNAMGDDQAFASMIGNAQTAVVALALTEDAYVNFATSFSEGMLGVTEAARGVTLESIESKMARLDAASRSLQAQIGQDINSIKGFFIDVKFGFLSNVVSPIMSSPVGGAVSKIAAVTGMAAKTMLDMGSGALNAAAQMTTLAANISNAGGIAKMFKSSAGMLGASLKMLGTPLRVAGSGILGMGKSIIGALPAIGGYITSMWASAAATIAATWPILAIIAGVALLATGVFLLIKHWDKVTGFFTGLWNKVKGVFSAAWDWIKNLIFGTSDWVLVAVAVFFPFIGIPALIIKHWGKIKGFFSDLWGNITSGAKTVWNNLAGFFTGIWDKIKGAFSAAWGWIKNILFGTSDWILGAVAIFMPIVGIPALIIKHWESIKTFFVNLWNDPKATIQGFIDWVGGKIGDLIAPFKVVGDVVGGVFNKVGGFFKGIVGGGRESGTALNDAFASGIQSNASAPGMAFGNSLQTVSRQMPHSDAQEGPLSQLTASGRALTDTFASGMDEDVLRDKANLVFSGAMPLDYSIPERQGAQGGSQPIHIQNLYLQAEDCENLLDFVRMIMHSVNRPEELPV